MSPLQKYTLTDKKALQWAESHPPILNYLSKINADKPQVAQDLYLYCEWVKKTPEELLSLKTDYTSLDAERLLDSFVTAKVNMPDTKKWHIVMRVRGFYRTNYRDLQRAAGKMEYPPCRDLGAPTKKVRRALISACYNPRDKAIIMLSTCTALALETLGSLRWSHFEEDWPNQAAPHISLPSSMLKGHGLGKYRGVRQETFCTTETRNTLMEYRDWFSKTFNYTWGPNDYVLLQAKLNIGEPLGRAMVAKRAVELSTRAGVHFSTHDGRRIVQPALESLGCSNNWIKKIKGRKVAGEEAPYSKPAIEQLRKKYAEALPELEFLQENETSARQVAEMKTENEELKVNQHFADRRIEELEAAVAKLYKFINEKDTLERMAENSLRAERTRTLKLPPTAR